MDPTTPPAPARGKRSYLLIGIIVVIVLLVLWAFGSYNSLVSAKEGVDSAWAQVEAQYQRRFDAIPNLVETVKGAANFEQSTLVQVTQARTSWLSAPSRDAKVEAAEQFESALARLLVTMESYPQLQATQAFRDLMVQIEGTENRIQVARQDYNETVEGFNRQVKRFPTVLVAGMLGFGPEEYFDATAGSEVAPSVNFDSSAASS